MRISHTALAIACLAAPAAAFVGPAGPGLMLRTSPSICSRGDAARSAAARCVIGMPPTSELVFRALAQLLFPSSRCVCLCQLTF